MIAYKHMNKRKGSRLSSIFPPDGNIMFDLICRASPFLCEIKWWIIEETLNQPALNDFILSLRQSKEVIFDALLPMFSNCWTFN